MVRIAGDDSYYSFRLCRISDKGKSVNPTSYGFTLPSVTTIIDTVLGKPFAAGAWWGYRMGIGGIVEALAQGGIELDLSSAETAERDLRAFGVDPIQAKERAGDRGSFAHDVLEFCVAGRLDWAWDCADYEREWSGTRYCEGVISWWTEQTKTIKNLKWAEAMSEVPVWSLQGGYAGTFDLAVPLEVMGKVTGWHVMDLKTHKPAAGFTKEDKGPAYLSDLIQIRAYRTAFEEMDLGKTISSRVIVARENGTFLQDYRSVPESVWEKTLDLYYDLVDLGV